MDRAYSLLSIFDVHIPLRYGEGMASAFRRLEEEIDKLNKCVQDLRLTDPRDDKKRIEETDWVVSRAPPDFMFLCSIAKL